MKNAFEASGSSPTISQNGAPVLTGRGVESARLKILAEFDKIHGGHPTLDRRDVEKPPQVYSETQEERFHQRAKVLINSALTLPILSASHISKSTNGAWEITVPTESAEDLIAALRGNQ